MCLCVAGLGDWLLARLLVLLLQLSAFPFARLLHTSQFSPSENMAQHTGVSLGMRRDIGSAPLCAVPISFVNSVQLCIKS